MMIYQLNCTQAEGADVVQMQQQATEVTYETFLKTSEPIASIRWHSH